VRATSRTAAIKGIFRAPPAGVGDVGDASSNAVRYLKADPAGVHMDSERTMRFKP
jgi:hypothetical protein